MKSEWTIKRLSEIADFNPRERLSKGTMAKKIAMDKLHPYCRDVSDYEVTAFTGGIKFRNGDTIMARITPCLENGKIAKVNVLDEEEVGFGSTEYIVFRAKKNIADPDYIYYLVCSPVVRKPAIKSMVGSSGRQRVQTDIVQRLEIQVPPLAEQQKIAGILKALDDKIELNSKINKNLEEQAISIFKDIFPNVTNGDFSIGQYITPKRGKGLLSKDAISGDFPVIAGGLTPAIYHNVANTIAPVITISASGANAGYISLWNIPVWSSDSSFIDRSITENVFFWYVMLKTRQKEIFHSQTGSAQPHIYPRHIQDLHCSKLDSIIVTDYNKMVTPLFEQIGNNIAENSKLSDLRDILLPKLMSGELDVLNIDI